MSAAEPLKPDTRIAGYVRQNKGRSSTPAQRRAIRRGFRNRAAYLDRHKNDNVSNTNNKES